MDMVKTAHTSNTTSKCQHCDRTYRIPEKDGSEDTCPTCARLIKLGIDPSPNKN
jgi:PHP family Zn ribbon phosphoesterase